MTKNTGAEAFAKVESSVSDALSGETLKSALEFIAYLKSSGMAVDTETPHPQFYYMDEWACMPVFFKDDNDPRGKLFICWNDGDICECADITVTDALKEFARANVQKCWSCGGCDDPSASKKRTRTVFGERHDNVCCNIFQFADIDEAKLKMIIQLMELWKRTVAESKRGR